MPEAAGHVKDLLLATESSSISSPLGAQSRVVSAAAIATAETPQTAEGSGGHQLLDKYVRRKKQLEAELSRKRTLLARLLMLEKEFLQSVRDREASLQPTSGGLKPPAPPRSSSLSMKNRPKIKVSRGCAAVSHGRSDCALPRPAPRTGPACSTC